MKTKTTVATSLLDRRVRIIISCDPELVTDPTARAHYESMKKEMRAGIWAYWGDYGFVRAVYQDAEKNLMTTIQRQNTGELIEVHAGHLQVVAPPAQGADALRD